MTQFKEKAFKILREIKSVTIATLNEGEPDARIVDVMLSKNDGLYFITATGKPYFRQLRENPRVAISALDSDYNMIRVRGEIRFLDDETVTEEIFKENPMLHDLYPGETKDILVPFQLFRGRWEVFSLSAHPPVRKRFAFGEDELSKAGYSIRQADCTACGLCVQACPSGSVSEKEQVYTIESSTCIECGRCRETCPADAIDPSPGL